MMSDYTVDDPALAPDHDNRVQLNRRYVCAIVGVVKCLQLILGLITLICAGVHLSCSPIDHGGNMTSTVMITSTVSSTTTSLLPTTPSSTSTETSSLTSTTTTTTTETSATTTNGSHVSPEFLDDEVQAENEVLREGEKANLFYSTIGAYGIGFVLFAGSVCFIGTFLLLITHSCNLRNACCHRVSHNQLHNIEFYFTIIAALLYLISFGVQAWYSASWESPNSYQCNKQAWEAAAAFAFFTLLAYMAGFYTVIKQPR